jgi:anti-sigma-K factor RskA
MWNRNRHADNDKLDQIGDELLRAFEASEAEINTAATSPFLYRRIRVRIEAEERRRAEERNPWFALLVMARRAIPALALIAMLAASWNWVAWERTAPNPTNSLSELSFDLASEDADEVDASLTGWPSGDLPNRQENQ